MKQSIRYCASAVFLLVTPAAFAQTAAPSSGYTNIMHLQLGEDGVWRADAARNGQPVKVLFDFQGNITTQ